MSTIFMTISLFCVSGVSFSETIEVFTTSALPVNLQGFSARLCELDALEKLTVALNQGSFFGEDARHKEAVHYRKIRDFYRCQHQAMQYDLQSLPAVVVDKTFVVYGARAVDKALILARHYRGSEHA
jgi:hypothetical protein